MGQHTGPLAASRSPSLRCADELLSIEGEVPSSVTKTAWGFAMFKPFARAAERVFKYFGQQFVNIFNRDPFTGIEGKCEI